MAVMGRIMGIDVGSVRVGVALSDELGITARPHATIPRRGDRATAEALSSIAAENAVGRIVVGLPLRLDGGDQDVTRDARRLAKALAAASGLAVVTWDERLTTVQAERSLIEGGVRRARRREVVDQVAAALMLQSFLDAGAPAARTPPGALEPSDP